MKKADIDFEVTKEIYNYILRLTELMLEWDKKSMKELAEKLAKVPKPDDFDKAMVLAYHKMFTIGYLKGKEDGKKEIIDIISQKALEEMNDTNIEH